MVGSGFVVRLVLLMSMNSGNHKLSCMCLYIRLPKGVIKKEYLHIKLFFTLYDIYLKLFGPALYSYQIVLSFFLT